MKKILFALAVLAVAAVACEKPEPEVPDTTPAELISFKILAADNEGLDADYAPEAIEQTMVIRIPGGGQGKTIKATLTAGENDEIKVNDVAVVEGKASFDASFPVDIVVTNTKSKKSAQYEVKIGKILQIVSKKLGVLPASEGMAYTTSGYRATINPATGELWVAYTFTPTGGKKNIGVKKFSNGDFVQVGTEGIVPAAEGGAIAASIYGLKIASDGTAYALYYGGDASNNLSVRKFDGTNWVLVGNASFSGKINTSFGPYLHLDASEKPFVVHTTSTYGNGFFYLDGDEWKSGVITGFPEYIKGGTRGSNEGIFYGGPVAVMKGKAYGFFTANWYGLYVYEYTGSSWTATSIADYMETGEKNMLPGNMATAVKDEKILLLATNQVAAQEQIYEFDGTKLSKYGDAFSVPVSTSGSPDPVVFGVNPVNGQILVVMLDKDDYPIYSVMDENRKWEQFVPIGGVTEQTVPGVDGGEPSVTIVHEVPASYGNVSMGFDKKGNALVIWPDANRKESGFPLWSIGLEDDVLPE